MVVLINGQPSRYCVTAGLIFPKGKSKHAKLPRFPEPSGSSDRRSIIRFRSIKQKLSVQKARPILKLQIENTKFAATINLTCVSPLILYEINKKFKGYK